MANDKDKKTGDEAGFAAQFADFHGDLDGIKRVHNDRAPEYKPKPKPIPRQAKLDDARVMDELLYGEVDREDLEGSDHISFAREGVQKNVMRRLKKGNYAVQASLDLHGFTVEDARQETAAFLIACAADQLRCVHIIHGKSGHTLGESPKLKNMLNRWLPARKQVIAMCSARPEDGGTGAVYVLLRKAES